MAIVAWKKITKTTFLFIVFSTISLFSYSKNNFKEKAYTIMAYAIFEIEKENERIIDEIKKDDLVSRQSIWTRDAKSLGLEGEKIYLKIEGDEEAIEKAKEIIGDKGKLLEGGEAEKINEKFVADEEKASEGMGFIFG